MPVPDFVPPPPTSAEATAYQIFTDAVSVHTIAMTDPKKSKADRVCYALAVKRAWQTFMALAANVAELQSDEDATIIHRESYAFMVWRRNGGRAPRSRHQTLEDASAEALRVSKERPGASYLVLQEVLRVKSNPVPLAHAQPTVEPGGSTPPSDSSGSKSGDWRDVA